MRKLAIVASVVLAAGLTLAVAAALANRGNGNHGNNLGAKLNGYQETPAESTPGHGTLRLRIVGGDTIHYVLHYEGFEPAEGATTAAHIHFGQFGVGGGVMCLPLRRRRHAPVHGWSGHVRRRHRCRRHRRAQRAGHPSR